MSAIKELLNRIKITPDVARERSVQRKAILVEI